MWMGQLWGLVVQGVQTTRVNVCCSTCGWRNQVIKVSWSWRRRFGFNTKQKIILTHTIYKTITTIHQILSIPDSTQQLGNASETLDYRWTVISSITTNPRTSTASLDSHLALKLLSTICLDWASDVQYGTSALLNCCETSIWIFPTFNLPGTNHHQNYGNRLIQPTHSNSL